MKCAARRFASACGPCIFSAVLPLTAAHAQPAEPVPGATSLSFHPAFGLSGEGKWIERFTLTPRILQMQDQPGSLGIGYELVSRPLARDLTEDVPIGSPPPKIRRFASFEFSARGLYAARAEANNENLIDAAASGTYELTYGPVVAKSAFSAAYSRQQGNGTSLRKWEVSQGVGTWLRGLRDTEVITRLALARVDPTHDADRQAALGGPLDSYRRWEFEGLVVIPVLKGALQKIELGHRRFHEIDAPSAVRAAGLDRFRLSSICFQLEDGFFIAYTRGGLPADRKDSQVLHMGWSTNIGE